MASDKKFVIYGFVLLSGMAALVWEVLWQVKSSLALGVSAWGTALTLAVTMGGMSIGALTMGKILKNRTVAKPERIYAGLEWIIGIAGFFLGALFSAVEKMDTAVFFQSPGAAPAVFILGIAAAIGIPTLAMGATLPVLGLMSQRWNASIAIIYGLNTLGAAAGTLIAAFVLIPAFGVAHTIWVISALNIIVGVLAWIFSSYGPDFVARAAEEKTSVVSKYSFRTSLAVVFVTGFATFALEVAWFRSLRAAFMSTTDAFAIMLSCVLIALGTAPVFIAGLKKSKDLGVLLAWAGIFILLATPIIERFDMFTQIQASSATVLFFKWFMSTLWVVGLPVMLLGLALPWLLEEQKTPSRWSLLYGTNTFAAIVGAIVAGWIFLPTIGFAHTAWIAGGLVAITGIYLAPAPSRKVITLSAMVALAVAAVFESGVGRDRVQGAFRFGRNEAPTILKSYEGPDSSIAVAAYKNGGRSLFIDGFIATQQADEGVMKDHTHYMLWMGHLPMAAHPDPKNALVICFGTGQTANSVRKENPASLDIVDINEHVFDLAEYFPANEGVLNDNRVTPYVMDGRAYLRRHDKIYDVITLEPMPPNFAGVNSLYSREFYQLAKSRLSEAGMIAQWLPFHLMTEETAKSIAKTFQDVFPNSILWRDPRSKTGILLGTKDADYDLGKNWPGYDRLPKARDLSISKVRDMVVLDQKELADYGAAGTIITDDNQFLAYGRAALMIRNNNVRGKHALVETFKD